MVNMSFIIVIVTATHPTVNMFVIKLLKQIVVYH
jgi:hypothetical protein